LKNREGFCSNLSQGAVIDFDVDPDLQDMAAFSVKNFGKQTKINLAGIDILFSSDAQIKEPLFLEINYFFGRKGLGGSEKYYELLVAEIRRWIKSLSEHLSGGNAAVQRVYVIIATELFLRKSLQWTILFR
jgi:ribosomal protein S6--L-glutamate ligase